MIEYALMTHSDATSPACLGEFHLTSDEGLEGWCWYPDLPDERAVVELLINGDVIRAARATRFLQNRRELGMGDGYCGFWFPIPSEIDREQVRTVLEVRERRFQQIFGRVAFGSTDGTREMRLETVRVALATINGTLDGMARAPRFSDSLKELGQTLLHLATRPHDRAKPRVPGLAACLERVTAVPAADLGWSPAPLVSIIVPPPTDDLVDLATTLRDASRALASLGAEFILLDDGALPLTALLPTRLRHLQLLRTDTAACRGSSLNAAVAIARGSFLAFAHPGGPNPAGLSEAVRETRPGILDLDSAVIARRALAGAKPQLHRLRCLVGREDFIAMGGFDPGLEEEAMWLDIIAKAGALGMHVHIWEAPLSPRLLQPQVAGHV